MKGKEIFRVCCLLSFAGPLHLPSPNRAGLGEVLGSGSPHPPAQNSGDTCARCPPGLAPATPRSPARPRGGDPRSQRRSHDGVKARGRGEGRGCEGRCGANRRLQSPRGRELGARSQEPGAERAGLGPGRAGAERSGEGARPPQPRVPPPSPPQRGPAATAQPWNRTTAPGRSSSRSRCWSRTLTPRRRSRCGAGRGGWGLAQPRTRDPGPSDPRALPGPPRAARL